MDKITTVGIDIDFYTEKPRIRNAYLKEVRARCTKFGTIILDVESPSGRGRHLKVRLNRQVGFWRSIEIRYYCKDDVKRMFFDIMRHRSGGTINDVLFDRKSRPKNP